MSLTFRRPLVQALVVSALIHLVLLLSVAALVPERAGLTVAAIKAVMNVDTRRPATAPVNAPARTAVPTREQSNVTTAKPSFPVHRKPEEPAVLAVAPTPGADASSVAAPAAASTAAPVGALAASVESSPGSVARAAPGSAVAGPEAISKNDVADLRTSLGLAAKGFKRYPRLAQERGWEGTVEIVLSYSVHLPSPEIRVARSSGRSVLDEQALDMLSRAARTTALPAGLRGRDFQVSVPVVFSLEDAQ